jgi:predicted nucleic acid-binding protein
MIILDTNVISEPMRPIPDAKVLAWIDRQPIDTLCFTAVNLAELMSGIERLPEGKRKRTLRAIAKEMIDSLFRSRILSFDAAATRKLAEINNAAV